MTMITDQHGVITIEQSPAKIRIPTGQSGLQFSIGGGAGDAVGGTATLKGRPFNAEDFEVVKDITTGSAVSISISGGQQTFIIDSGRFSAVEITLVGTGAGKTVAYSFVGV